MNAEVGMRKAEVGVVGIRNVEVKKVGMRLPAWREGGINECGNVYDGGRESGFAELKRIEVPSLPLSERHGEFREVELCFTDEQVKQETHRCLQCDLEICLAKARKGS